MEVFDWLEIRFIKIHPDLYSIAHWVWHLRWDESKSIDFLTMLKILTNKFKREILVNFFFIWLRFWYLEDKSTTFLILLILPFRLNTFSEKFNRIDFFERLILVFVSWLKENYVFCLYSSLRKKLEREAMGDTDQK